jgi:hypothetical protein
MVLGLQTPAQAAITITALSPTSGPANCIVVATGTGFRDFPAAQTTVSFVSGATVVPATNFFAFSDGLTMWVAAPAALVPGTSYNLRVDNPGTTDPGITSTATFLSTTGAGACAPTITSFTPTCGSAFDTVTITGTNLQDTDMDGGAVFFSPYAAAQEAAPVVPDVSDVTSLTVVVPTGAADGPIQVVTDIATGGTVFSTANFLVPPPDCLPETGNVHARSITLSLSGHVKAKGKVSSTEDPAFTDCVSGVPVKIQRKTSSGWKNVGSATTSDTGSYSKKVKDKAGKYRAIAKKVTLGDPVTDTCSKATSPTRKHKH